MYWKSLGVLVIFSGVVFLLGCEVHRENNSLDHNRAEMVADSFYINIMKGKRVDVANLFSGNSTPEDAAKKFSILDSSLGVLVDYEIKFVTTNIVAKDEHETGTYEIISFCNYERGRTEETLFVVVRDSSYYLDGYAADIYE